MCGRYVTKAEAEIERFWNIERSDGTGFLAHFNAAPTQNLPVIRIRKQQDRALNLLRWGLVPSWAKDTKMGKTLFNARGETIADRPAFRAAFKRRRCLVPVTGYYEWQKTPGGKVPHYIHLLNCEQFAIAGLHEFCAGKDGADPIESYTIITTGPNEMIARIYDRMPVILPEDAHAEWLDPSNGKTDALQRLLQPYSAEEMCAYPVSPRVNSTRNDGPELIQPA
jgi:putative SOS response-associated peptidase YedK